MLVKFCICLEHSGWLNSILLFRSPFFMHHVVAHDPNKCPTASIAKFPNFSRAHISKPLFACARQAGDTIILAGSEYNRASRYCLGVTEESLQFSWWFVCIKYLRPFYLPIARIDNHDMQTSLPIMLIILNFDNQIIYWDCYLITGIVSSGWNL